MVILDSARRSIGNSLSVVREGVRRCDSRLTRDRDDRQGRSKGGDLGGRR